MNNLYIFTLTKGIKKEHFINVGFFLSFFFTRIFKKNMFRISNLKFQDQLEYYN